MATDVRQSLTISNRLGELARVERWLARLCEQWTVPPRAAFAIDLVINESVTNVISYAYRDARDHAIEISLNDTATAVIVEVVDDGAPFNPFDAPPMMAAPDLAHATVGGHGIHLIRSYADAHHYEQVAGRNRLTLVIGKR